MSTTRRSFLALLVAAAVVPKPRKAVMPRSVTMQLGGEKVRPYLISDTVTIQPGQPFEEVLFAPPLPLNEFMVRSLGFRLSPETPVADAHLILQGCSINIRRGKRCVSEKGMPLMYFPSVFGLDGLPCGSLMPLLTEITVPADDDFGVTFNGASLPLLSPATVQVVLQGVILV